MREEGCQPLAFAGDDTPDEVLRFDSVSQPRCRLPAELPPGTRALLAHRRLSILDVSAAGHQPMASADRRRWIVFNGEIFNFKELRTELEMLGHTFVSGSDTEVILAAYDAWGEGCLSHFNGMFAFLLLDLERGCLFVARDRFGIKPMYFRVFDGTRIAFGSEIKQLLALGNASPRANNQRVYDFLVWSTADHSNETMFQDVEQLPPGSCWTLPLDYAALASALGQRTIVRWYDLQPADVPADRELAIAMWGELLRDSVRLRLRSDVPVGSCLSGGLDSSSIVCLVNKELASLGGAARQRVFTAVADDVAFDERPWSNAVVAATGVESRSIQPDAGGLLSNLHELTWHQDEPFATTSTYAQWEVFGLAASVGVRVMLDGQGADEQLGGYHGFFAARHAQLLRAGRWGQLVTEMRHGRRLHGHTHADQLMQMANVLLPEGARQSVRGWSGHAVARPNWLNLSRLRAHTRDPLRELGALAPGVNGMSRAQLTKSNLQRLLHWEDRNSMAHSIEARVPFLDYRLVEFTLGLPEELKIADGVSKRVLRDAMRGVIPEVVRTRMSKLGFTTPEESWLTGSQHARFEELVREAVARSNGILDRRVVKASADVLERKAPFNLLPWRVISFGAWLKAFDVQL